MISRSNRGIICGVVNPVERKIANMLMPAVKASETFNRLMKDSRYYPNLTQFFLKCSDIRCFDKGHYLHAAITQIEAGFEENIPKALYEKLPISYLGTLKDKLKETSRDTATKQINVIDSVIANKKVLEARKKFVNNPCNRLLASENSRKISELEYYFAAEDQIKKNNEAAIPRDVFSKIHESLLGLLVDDLNSAGPSPAGEKQIEIIKNIIAQREAKDQLHKA